MPSKVKVTVSLDSELVRELNQAGRRTGKPRSRLVEEALEHWRRSRLAEELKEGIPGYGERGSPHGKGRSGCSARGGGLMPAWPHRGEV